MKKSESSVNLRLKGIRKYNVKIYELQMITSKKSLNFLLIQDEKIINRWINMQGVPRNMTVGKQL